MKAPSPAFSLYPKDILSDEACALMTHEQFGCYMRLLLHSWLEGSIPADPTRLARLLGVNGSKFGAIWPGIAPCWEPSADEPGRLVQGRQERQRQKQEAFAAVQASKGAKGGKSKAANKTPKPVLDPGYVPAVAGGKPEASLPFPSPFPSPQQTTDEVVEEPRVRAPEPPADPVIEAEVSEGNRLIRAVGDRYDLDPLHVIRRASLWGGGRGQAPSSLTRLDLARSGSRVRHTIDTLRTWLDTGRTPEQQRSAHFEPRRPTAAERANDGVTGALEILRRQDAQAGLRALPVGEVVVDAH